MPAYQLPALPDGFSRQGPTLGPSSSDGATAYACAPAPNSSHAGVVTWLTHDRGANWQPTGGIAVDIGSPIEVTDCQILVDATQTGIAVAQIGYFPAGGCFPAVDCIEYALYVTTDLGQRWTRLLGPHNPLDTRDPSDTLDTLAALATYQQATYALFRSAPRSASFGIVEFMVSRDNLHSWTPVTGLPGVTNPGTNVEFWLNPWSGDLLVMTMGPFYNQETFLTSSNGGHSWTTLPASPFSFAIGDIVVQQPFTNQPWRICGGDTSSAIIDGVRQNTHMDDVACTADGGAHWLIHRLSLSADGVTGPGGAPYYTLVGIADDGSLLLFIPNAGYDLPAMPVELERVVSGVSGVQALGPAPSGGQIIYAAGSGVGVLWSAPQNNYTNPDPQGRIFTATYA